MGTSDRSAAFQGEQRLYQIVARRIVRMIDAHRDDPAWRIPAERELAEMLAVSRPVVREAIIALEVRGIVEVKGRAGILIKHDAGEAEDAAAPEPASGIGMIEFVEARLALETNLAALAARRADAFDLESLEECIRSMQSPSASTADIRAADRRFHRTLARMNGNALLISLHDQLIKAGDQSAVVDRLENELYAPHRAFVRSGDLGTILAAIRSGQPNAAYEASARQINTLRAELHERDSGIRKPNHAEKLFADPAQDNPEMLVTDMKQADH